MIYFSFIFRHVTDAAFVVAHCLSDSAKAGDGETLLAERFNCRAVEVRLASAILARKLMCQLNTAADIVKLERAWEQVLVLVLVRARIHVHKHTYVRSHIRTSVHIYTHKYSKMQKII